MHEGSGMLQSEPESDERPSTINGSWIIASSSSYPSSDLSSSSHWIVNAWRMTHVATQYIAIKWLFLSLIVTWRSLREWNQPLRNPMACSDECRLLKYGCWRCCSQVNHVLGVCNVQQPSNLSCMITIGMNLYKSNDCFTGYAKSAHTHSPSLSKFLWPWNMQVSSHALELNTYGVSMTEVNDVQIW